VRFFFSMHLLPLIAHGINAGCHSAIGIGLVHGFLEGAVEKGAGITAMIFVLVALPPPLLRVT